MKGCIVERSPGRFAIIVDEINPDSGIRKRKWHSFSGTRSAAEKERDRIIARSEIWSGRSIFDGKYRAVIVRYLGEESPFAVLVAASHEELFWLIDAQTNPYDCEATTLTAGDGFFFCSRIPSEMFADKLNDPHIWWPVGEGMREHFARQSAQAKISRLENEAADLGKIFKRLNRKANDRFNGHRRRARKNARAMEKA